MATELNGLGKLLFVLFRVFWTALVILVPALGVWVASSLAAYQNGPVWLVCVAGLLLFPALPGLWEFISAMRKRKRQRRWHRQVLTTWDRLILRTLALNLVFLGGLMWARPEAIFTALSSRGDWVLDHAKGEIADELRPYFLGAADGLQWLYEAAHDNEFEALVDGDGEPPPPPPPPADDDRDSSWSDPWKAAPTDENTGATTPPEPPKVVSGEASWPSPSLVHPAILAMPDATKSSVEAVGEYIAAADPDPYSRVKAIHDFAATHVAYDAVALAEGRYPDQSAETVLRTGLGVCAGYANLMKAIGEVTGDEIVVVTGDSRKRGGEIAGGGHAWNAAKIGERWYLIDSTWDAGHVDGRTFTAEYSTDYLFTPAPLMGITHFPEDPAWQLRAEPISRGEFTRQPMMRPSFFAQGFSLVAPTRSQFTVDHDIELTIGNSKGQHMIAKAVPMEGGPEHRCAVEGERELAITCSPPGAGTYNVQLYTSPEAFGTFWMVGEVQANVRG